MKVFNGECEICTRIFDEERFVVSLTCGHILCTSCQSETSGTCPFCRQTYDLDDIRRLYLSTHEINSLTEGQQDYIKLRQELDQLQEDRSHLRSLLSVKTGEIEQLTRRLDAISTNAVKLMPFVRLINTDSNVLNQIYF